MIYTSRLSSCGDGSIFTRDLHVAQVRWGCLLNAFYPHFEIRKVSLCFIAVFFCLLYPFFRTGWAEVNVNAEPRLRIVGSTALYGFSASVAERFGRMTPYKTPLIEANGTGGGFKIFCQGNSNKSPNAVNASRPIEKSERRYCEKNHIFNLIELKVGHDGIVLASHFDAPEMDLTLEELFKALAKVVEVDGKWVVNPYKRWSDIHPRLPAQEISILGPPPSSGTYSVLVELILKPFCPKGRSTCLYIRTDGAFIQASEHETIIAQKLTLNAKKVGVFSFSFLKHHKDILKAMKINGKLPTFETIKDKTYPLSRSLYVYTTEKQLWKTKSLQEFLRLFYDNQASGPRGYLTLKGLVPLSSSERQQMLNLFPKELMPNIRNKESH